MVDTQRQELVEHGVIKSSTRRSTSELGYASFSEEEERGRPHHQHPEMTLKSMTRGGLFKVLHKVYFNV